MFLARRERILTRREMERAWFAAQIWAPTERAFFVPLSQVTATFDSHGGESRSDGVEPMDERRAWGGRGEAPHDPVNALRQDF